MRTNNELIEQTNELAKRFAAMDGLYIKTPNPDFRNINTPECQKFWSMACLAQEMLTGADPHTCNNVRAVTEVTGDDADIKREFDRIDRATQRTTELEAAYMQFERIAADCDVTIEDVLNAQTKSPSAGN